MIGILTQQNDDPNKSIPILDSDGSMKCWEHIHEAKEYAKNHELCQAAIIMFIDLMTQEITEIYY